VVTFCGLYGSEFWIRPLVHFAARESLCDERNTIQTTLELSCLIFRFPLLHAMFEVHYVGLYAVRKVRSFGNICVSLNRDRGKPMDSRLLYYRSLYNLKSGLARSTKVIRALLGQTSSPVHDFDHFHAPRNIWRAIRIEVSVAFSRRILLNVSKSRDWSAG